MPVQFALNVSIIGRETDHLPVMSEVKQQTPCRFELLFLEITTLVRIRKLHQRSVSTA